MEFIKNLEIEFLNHTDPNIAVQQKAYMRNQFDFLGIKTPQRRSILKPFLKKENLPAKQSLVGIVQGLWEKPEREYQYSAQELASKYSSQPEEDDLALYEYMLSHSPWWDTVDFIAAILLGSYFRSYPEKIKESVDRWLASGDIWFQRSAILFQLKYRKQTDTELLVALIHSLEGSKEFFINKAIGWMLREYSKTDPAWVRFQCQHLPLNPLSRREALRRL